MFQIPRDVFYVMFALLEVSIVSAWIKELKTREWENEVGLTHDVGRIIRYLDHRLLEHNKQAKDEGKEPLDAAT